jgi:hypothetical protein
MTRAIFAVFLAALAVVLFANRSESIFGADSSGYINLARTVSAGHVTWPIPALERVRCDDCEPGWFVPIGFVLTPDRRTMASVYPIGLPLHLALAARIGGWQHAPFVVSPIAGLLVVLVTYWLARRLASELAGMIAAVLIGTCAVFVFQSLQPMSDVLAAAWSVAAIAAAVESRRRDAFAILAGFCLGMAVLVRPTSAMLLLPLAFALPWRLRTLAAFVAGGLPAAIFLGWYDAEVFGSVFASGYDAGGATRDFKLSYFAARAVHYLRWTVQQFSPMAVAAAIATLFFRAVPLRDRIMLALWFAAFFVFYSFYFWYDTWWYTRFLLPAYPAIAIAAGIAFARVLQSPRVPRPAVVVTAMCVVVVVAWEARGNARFAVLFTDEDQHRARVTSEWVARALPPGSLVLSMEYSSALLHYTTHRPVRWDVAPPERTLALARAAHASGVETYALLMPHEEQRFLAMYGESFHRVASMGDGTLFAMNPTW